MNTRAIKSTIIPTFLVGLLTAGNVQADLTADTNTLNYNNRAYVHAIHNAPNPVGDITVELAKMAYADKAFGQAIYSYPATVAFQETDFNVEYVDTANGQAIYSYPNNNPVKHHLELSAETGGQPLDNSILPAALRKTSKLSTPVIP